MDVSFFLGRVLGIYLVVMCLVVLIKSKSFQKIFQSFSTCPAATFVCGFFAFIIGLLMVVSHNLWVSNWRIIITVIGWIAVIKGVLLVLAPEKLIGWSRKAYKIIPVAYVILLVVGGYLIYVSFIA